MICATLWPLQSRPASKRATWAIRPKPLRPCWSDCASSLRVVLLQTVRTGIVSSIASLPPMSSSSASAKTVATVTSVFGCSILFRKINLFQNGKLTPRIKPNRAQWELTRWLSAASVLKSDAIPGLRMLSLLRPESHPCSYPGIDTRFLNVPCFPWFWTRVSTDRSNVVFDPDFASCC